MTMTSGGASTSMTSPRASASRARRIAAVRSDERGGGATAATTFCGSAARAARQGVDRFVGDFAGGEAGGGDRLFFLRGRSSENSAPARSALSTRARQSSLRRSVCRRVAHDPARQSSS